MRERWFWRKRDGFVSFEGEEERFWGEGQPWMTVKTKISEKLDFDCVCLGLLLYL